MHGIDDAAPAPPLYDRLATVYDRWLTGDDDAEPCLRFYREEFAGHPGPVLELGCGTGRIMAALRSENVPVVGIDLSRPMLRHAAEVGSAETPAHLVQGRFERLPLRSGSLAAAIMPMRTVGHLLDRDSQLAMFREVVRVLRPGGRFVLDHYNFDEAWAREHDGVPRLMYAGSGTDGESSAQLIWDRYDYDFAARSLHCTVRIEEVGPSAALRSASTVEFDFRWFTAEELRELAGAAGLTVRSCWGDFDRAPFTETAEHLILVLER